MSPPRSGRWTRTQVAPPVYRRFGVCPRGGATGTAASTPCRPPPLSMPRPGRSVINSTLPQTCPFLGIWRMFRSYKVRLRYRYLFIIHYCRKRLSFRAEVCGGGRRLERGGKGESKQPASSTDIIRLVKRTSELPRSAVSLQG